MGPSCRSIWLCSSVQKRKKGKRVAYSTKKILGENVVLRLMEHLFPTLSFDIFMDNYLTSIHLLTHLGVNNIRAEGVPNKNRLRKCTIIGTNSCQKRNVATLNTAHQAKKLCDFDQNNSRRVYIASSEPCEPKRFARC